MKKCILVLLLCLLIPLWAYAFMSPGFSGGDEGPAAVGGPDAWS